MNPSLSWKYLPDAITETVIELNFTGPADLRARRSILRQAHLTGLKTPTAYLFQNLELTTKGIRLSLVTAALP